jgi:hypothetical protein
LDPKSKGYEINKKTEKEKREKKKRLEQYENGPGGNVSAQKQK